MEFGKILNQTQKNVGQIKKIAAKLKITLPSKFAQQLDKLNDCINVYSATKSMIVTVVSDATNVRDLAGWTNMLTHFDANWDIFAKQVNDIFNKANPDEQTNILETFAREHFGETIFEAGSILKNETPQILSGIIEFKNATKLFGGSYNDPIEAIGKIRNGVSGIVRSTEKIAKSADNIIKFIQKKRGIDPTKSNTPFTKLGNLTNNKIIATSISTLNIGVSGINTFQRSNEAIDSLKKGDYKSALSASNGVYKEIKNIVSEIKNLKNKMNSGVGTELNTTGSAYSRSYAKTSKSDDIPASAETASLPAYSYICSKAKIKCSNGDMISTLTVLPSRTIWLYGQPQANISDHLSMINIAPCGKCHTTYYPPTGSATAANHGKLTPMPCVPNTPFPWMGGKNDVLLKGDPALISTSKLKCVYGGTITITFDGQNV